MKNERTVLGILRIIEALPNSYHGNPRYLVTIGDDEYRTPVDSMLAHRIAYYDRRPVVAIVGSHYGKPTVRTVKKF